jgi:hypothetical protein
MEKETIYNAVSQMNVNDLVFLYEQIKHLERLKNIPVKKKEHFSIEQILDMTSSSESSWSDTVTEERAERI